MVVFDYKDYTNEGHTDNNDSKKTVTNNAACTIADYNYGEPLSIGSITNKLRNNYVIDRIDLLSQIRQGRINKETNKKYKKKSKKPQQNTDNIFNDAKTNIKNKEEKTRNKLNQKIKETEENYQNKKDEEYNEINEHEKEIEEAVEDEIVYDKDDEVTQKYHTNDQNDTTMITAYLIRIDDVNNSCYYFSKNRLSVGDRVTVPYGKDNKHLNGTIKKIVNSQVKDFNIPIDVIKYICEEKEK